MVEFVELGVGRRRIFVEIVLVASKAVKSNGDSAQVLPTQLQQTGRFDIVPPFGLHALIFRRPVLLVGVQKRRVLTLGLQKLWYGGCRQIDGTTLFQIEIEIRRDSITHVRERIDNLETVENFTVVVQILPDKSVDAEEPRQSTILDISSTIELECGNHFFESRK